MNLLALDTSTTRATLALSRGEEVHERLGPSAATGGRHGRNLLPEVADLLGAAGLKPRDLDALAVGLGPGSYTGLRVGVTAAKTLAFALGVPLVALDSFAAVARNAPIDARSVHVVADAQRGDLYLTRFARDEDAAPLASLEPIRVVAMAAWAAGLPPGTWVLGAALDRLRLVWPEGVLRGDDAAGQPSGAALIELGRAAVQARRWADPASVEPTYVRRSAAEDQWDRREVRS